MPAKQRFKAISIQFQCCKPDFSSMFLSLRTSSLSSLELQRCAPSQKVEVREQQITAGTVQPGRRQRDTLPYMAIDTDA